MKVFPLTPEQRRLYIEWRINPSSNAYNLTNVQFKLNGNLNIDKLERALVAQRKHDEAIRTYFIEKENNPFQVILDPEETINPSLNFIDLTENSNLLSQEELENQAYELHKNIMSNTSDLMKYPLVNYNLVKFSENDYLLTIVIPHILIDSQCKTKFLKTLIDLYNDYDITKQSLEKNSSYSISDYLQYLDSLAPEQKAQDSKYWIKKFSDTNSFRVILKESQITDKKSSSKRRGMISTSLPHELSIKLQEIATQERTTLFIVMAAIFNILLYRYFKKKNPITGYAVNIKPKKFQHLTGFFVNNLPLKVCFDNEPSFKEIVKQIMENRLEDRLHQTYSLENILGDLRKSNPNFDGRIFNIAFDETYSYPTNLLQLNGVNVEVINIRNDAESINDLAFDYGILPDKTIEYSFTYNENVLEKDFVEHLHLNWNILVKDIVNNLDYDLKSLLPYESENSTSTFNSIFENAADSITLPKKVEIRGSSIIENHIKDILKEILEISEINGSDNFFDLGCTSFNLISLHTQLPDDLKKNLTIADLFLFPTITSLAQYIEKNDLESSSLIRDEDVKNLSSLEGLDKSIAIIGLSGCFPGAANIDQFWDNLSQGKESIHFFSEEELLNSGVAIEEIKNSSYVPAKGIISNIDQFDADFFGLSPSESNIIDPQHRLFLMSSYHALEDAGYDSKTFQGKIGVFAGCGPNYYLLSHLWNNKTVEKAVGEYKLLINNLNDTLATSVSYKLNLSGSAVSVQTACSSSLVAVHLACQSLLSGENDIVLAGSASLGQLEQKGYLYQQGMIKSIDGHCRVFDAKATGIISAQGVGIIVLKRLEKAINDGDHIYAVIKGSAVNNDGAMKMSFTAPSRDKQAEVIELAQANAEINPETITYIEAHGTGTPIGDPIEISALTKAFSRKTKKKGYCAIGSVKSNIGHTDAASGIAGLIKTVLSLKHKKIPASLHFETANPEIDFEKSPFYVNTKLSEWVVTDHPRRAGVSSFGIGGTNAHVILEEAPIIKRASNNTDTCHLILLSAKTFSALDAMKKNLATYLEKNPNVAMENVAYTLSIGRSHMEHRLAFVCKNHEEAITLLKNPTHSHEQEVKKVIFMFPGQGSQYINMALDLYSKERLFKKEMDHCFDILKNQHNYDLKSILYPAPKEESKATELLNQTQFTQVALFVVEYALARFLMSLGINPDAMIGHSVGEYVAACLSGVFSLEDALKIIVMRGYLVQQLPEGSMLSVKLSKEKILPYLDKGISLAAVNSPSQCVLSGTTEAIEAIHKKLNQLNIANHTLKTSHAFHSNMMEPILDEFKKVILSCKVNDFKIPYISNVTGTWISNEDICCPDYWSKHLYETVNFLDGINKFNNWENTIAIEIGPGNTLSTLAIQNNPKTHTNVFTSLRHPKQLEADKKFLLNALANIWKLGKNLDFTQLESLANGQRIPLPLYPFQLKRYWIDPFHVTNDTTSLKNLIRKPIADWFYVPTWKKSVENTVLHKISLQKNNTWLIFSDHYQIGEKIADYLSRLGQNHITVHIGSQFYKSAANKYFINSKNPNDYAALIENLQHTKQLPTHILHLWNVYDNLNINNVSHNHQDLSFFSGLYLIQALGHHLGKYPVKLLFAANNLHNILGEEKIVPEKSTLLGLTKVIPQEYPLVDCSTIDLHIDHQILNNSNSSSHLVETLINEANHINNDAIIAYRGTTKWIQIIEKINLTNRNESECLLRNQGTYLITGGLGGIGLTFAEYLAEKFNANIILLGRTKFPAEEQWNKWLETHADNDAISCAITKLNKIKKSAKNLLILNADVSEFKQLTEVIHIAKENFSQINGIIHAAGIANDGFIQNKTINQVEQTFLAKIQGTNNLYQAIKNEAIDFFLVCSSLGTILGGLGRSDYNAANCFLNSFSLAYSRPSLPIISINWPGWSEVGMAVNKPKKISSSSRSITSSEGIEILNRMLTNPYNNLIISTQDVSAVLEELNNERLEQKNKLLEACPDAIKINIPSIKNLLIDIWKEALGHKSIEQNANFFDIGGDSLAITQVYKLLPITLQQNITIADLFQYPTLNDLTNFLESKLSSDEQKFSNSPNNIAEPALSKDIAIIGMAGYFPGASNIEQFWDNLLQGKESISFFNETELLEAGVSEQIFKNPQYVPAKGIIENIEWFDEKFFDITAKEAAVIDPQHRFLLKTAYQALEDAGYDSTRFNGRIGVYAGSGISCYFHSNLSENLNEDHVLQYKAMINNLNDTLATTVAYKLNLSGSAVSVQTACSSSLVAVHLACQSILTGENDMVIAGGVSFSEPGKTGYLYQEGMITSPDGHCKTFDSKANGTIMSQGIGLVLLKNVQAAINDGDHIYAVIKGSAVNNDGAMKMSFTAPSRDRQAEVVELAQNKANIHPETITYIETHGTGTSIGDPIEISALTKAFSSKTNKKGYCAIGSVKTNIGHTDAASGIAGLIKTALSLKYKKIPASLHFETPNPEIDFANSPFYVNTNLQEWKASDYPRRAGVSSFGIGGTNAHVILEEAPQIKDTSSNENSHQLLLLSAKTPTALETQKKNLADYLEKHTDVSMTDIAYTLQVGRQTLAYRNALVCENRKEAINLLRKEQNFVHCDTSKGKNIIFIFPEKFSGKFEIYQELFQENSIFRKEVENCISILNQHCSYHLDNNWDSQLNNQILLFIIEYSLARLWLSWGIKPTAIIGHGVGEYVAAHLHNVFTLEDALKIIVQREKYLNSKSNTQEQTIADYKLQISQCILNSPTAPYLSDSTGAWITNSQATDKNYWISKLTSHSFITETFQECALIPNHFLINIDLENPFINFGLLTKPHKTILPVTKKLLNFIGELWLNGISPEWNLINNEKANVRCSLPTYPFEEKKHWIETKNQINSKTICAPINPNHKNHGLLPKESIKNEVTSIWKNHLGLDQINVDANFFNLGGDSLFAIQVSGNIEKLFQIPFSVNDLINQPTIGEASKVIEERLKDNTKHHLDVNGSSSNLIKLKEANNGKPPLFLIHGIGGTIFNFRDIAKRIDQTIYALQSQALNEKLKPHSSIEEMAKSYISSIQTIQAHGPYYVAGHSFGGVVAYEISQQLYQKNEEVAFLGLLDAPDLKEEFSEKLLIDDASLIAFMLNAKNQHNADISFLRTLNEQDLYKYFMTHIGHSIEPSQIKHFLEIYKLNASALNDYKPSLYQQQRGMVVYYRAIEKDILNFKDPENYWEAYVGDNYFIESVKGNHHTMLTAPYINHGLIKKLNKNIENSLFKHNSQHYSLNEIRESIAQ